MSPLAMIERNRMPICIGLLMITWASPSFPIALHFGVIAICLIIMIATTFISLAVRDTSIGPAPLPLEYKLVMAAVLATLLFSIANRFFPVVDLDTSGMALPLITIIVVITSVRKTRIVRNADA